MTDHIDHSRKINRAIKMCSISAHPESVSAMLRAIPDEVIEALPARLIAQLIDANWQLAGASKAIAAADAIREGCVWDAQQGRHRDLAA